MQMLIVAVIFSLATLLLLWRGDPKRRRVAALPGGEQSVIARRLLVFALLLPGAAPALQGDAPAFLVWLGVCALGGWLIAQLRGRSSPE
jgi:hypothetical protein